MRRFVFVLLVGLGACGQDGGAPPVAVTRQPLIAAGESIKGQDLGPKEIVLTFDDGPGPLAVTGELADFLSKRPKPIVATFFVNGACIKATTLTPNEACPTPLPDADATLAKIRASGHWIGNHSTSHRSMPSIGAEVVKDIEETDALIAKYAVYNRLFFRAPYGDWSTAAFNAVKSTPMNKYAGPVYWTAGGGPTTTEQAADYDCWNKGFTSKTCGDLYLKDIKAHGNGAVLFHDPTGNTDNHAEDSGTGNTVDMVKYIVPKLEADGYTFKTLADVPALARVLPKCADADCVECSGAGEKTCLLCAAGKTAADGACVASASASDGGTESDAAGAPPTSTSSASSSSGDGGAQPYSPPVAQPEEGCSTTRGDGGSGAAIAFALALALGSKRRRRAVGRG